MWDPVSENVPMPIASPEVYELNDPELRVVFHPKTHGARDENAGVTAPLFSSLFNLNIFPRA